MAFKSQISEVIENFFLATNMPIQAFQFDGHFICSAGYNNRLNRLFDSYNIYEKIKLQISKEIKNHIVTISCSNNIFFTALPVCPKNIYRGLFILGPYSSDKNNNMNIIYKPTYLIPHLISFIHIVLKDCHSEKIVNINEKPYSLHVKKAMDYIDARYMDEITLFDVSNYLKINKSYFCSIFKKETGKTFTQYLNETRIEKSKSLLLIEDCSMLDVALSVGFNNQNYYNIMFKKITNKTPLEFKNNGKF